MAKHKQAGKKDRMEETKYKDVHETKYRDGKGMHDTADKIKCMIKSVRGGKIAKREGKVKQM